MEDESLQRVVEGFANLLQPLQGNSFYETEPKGFETVFASNPYWTSSVCDSETLEPASDVPSLSDGYASSSSSSPAEQLPPGLERGAGTGAHKREAVSVPYSPPMPTANPDAADEFIELDPNEGRRRGELLFAMLKPNEHEVSVAAAPLPPVRRDFRLQPHCMPASNSAAPHWHRSLPDTFQPGAASWGCQPGQSDHYAAPSPSAGNAYGDSVRQAAHLAFGDALAEVMTGTASAQCSSAYVVRIYDGTDSDRRAQVDALGRELRGILGSEVVGFEQRVSAGTSFDSACRSSGVLRIKLRSHGDGACWDFARRGCCPRGAHCMWTHNEEVLLIEVLS